MWVSQECSHKGNFCTSLLPFPVTHALIFQSESEVDVIAEQLKFRACLKILMTELRTLATGFEVDGGKLRFQLYSWLEKEIAAMHTICNYKVHLV